MLLTIMIDKLLTYKNEYIKKISFQNFRINKKLFKWIQSLKVFISNKRTDL